MFEQNLPLKFKARYQSQWVILQNSSSHSTISFEAQNGASIMVLIDLLYMISVYYINNSPGKFYVKGIVSKPYAKS